MFPEGGVVLPGPGASADQDLLAIEDGSTTTTTTTTAAPTTRKPQTGCFMNGVYVEEGEVICTMLGLGECIACRNPLLILTGRLTT